ncbi:MAG: hypothetical protein JW384_04135 [Nitrosomonadaceae bacterium]|nr:hypothetical protein [Nitrosomonadaceae bacterium]
MKLKKVAYALLLLAAAHTQAAEFEGETRWWKGNTHTHTWWSDGDTPPELVAQWYKEHGYQFLVLSDHNTLQIGSKWYPIDATTRPVEQIQKAYENYLAAFGSDWVEERVVDGKREVKIKTLDEFRALFEEANRFIFIKGEEITASHHNHPVHMNGVNLVDFIAPIEGSSVADTIQKNLDSVVAQGKQYNQPMFIHLNHPNFHFAETAEDFVNLDHAPGDGFFEMYNGHSDVRNYGDALHESTERMWDIVLAKRLGEMNRSVFYGLAVDDAHEYTVWGLGEVNPGRGWIMVKSQWLTPNKITDAIKHGDFYNSTGVTLKNLEITPEGIEIEIEPQSGVEYRVEFIGTLQNADLQGHEEANAPHEHESSLDHLHNSIIRYSADIGKVLNEVNGTKASYKVRGNEIYVRARITSTKLHANPYADGDVEMAWTQPLVVKTNNSQR